MNPYYYRIILIVVTAVFLIWSWTHSALTDDVEKNFKQANKQLVISEILNIVLAAYLMLGLIFKS